MLNISVWFFVIKNMTDNENYEILTSFGCLLNIFRYHSNFFKIFITLNSLHSKSRKTLKNNLDLFKKAFAFEKRKIMEIFRWDQESIEYLLEEDRYMQFDLLFNNVSPKWLKTIVRFFEDVKKPQFIKVRQLKLTSKITSFGPMRFNRMWKLMKECNIDLKWIKYKNNLKNGYDKVWSEYWYQPNIRIDYNHGKNKLVDMRNNPKDNNHESWVSTIKKKNSEWRNLEIWYSNLNELKNTKYQ